MKRVIPILIIVFAAWACEKNHSPVISGITCSPESRSAGTLFTLKATASDEDGNALQYRWSADGGTFTDSINKDQTVWKSPVDGNGKIFTIKVTVSDGKLETFLDYPILLSEPIFGHISGYAYFINCSIPVSGATISVEEKTTVTDTNGYFSLFDIPVGSYTLNANKADFSPANHKVNILQSVNLKVTISMISVLYSSKVYGIVKSQDSLPVSGATVVMLNPDNSESKITATSNSTGYYRLWYVPTGQRKIIARKAQNEEFGFEDVNLIIAITGPEYPLDIEMQKYSLVGQFTDRRDDHQYGYKIIGSQTWMTENLAYLPTVSPSSDGTDYDKYYYVYGYEGTSVSDAKAIANYTTYGVLYNWNAAQADCPVGWHLPSDAAWKVLENYLGPGAGYFLKSTSYWNSHGNGNNSSGFNALPGGNRRDKSGFNVLGGMAYFWSSTLESGRAWFCYLTSDDIEVYRSTDYKRSGFSVRCLKD